MCFSERASIIAFTIGIIGSILCVSLGTIPDKIVGFYLMFVALMQWIEYLLWRHPFCDNYNRIISIMGMILNNLQPVILGIILLVLTNRPKVWIWIIMVMYLCVVIPYSLQFFQSNTLQCTLKNEQSKHLYWNWNYLNNTVFVYTIFIFTICALALIGFPKRIHGVYFSIVTIITYVTSFIFYTQKYAGVIWCYYSVFLPIIYYLYRQLYKNTF